MSRRDVVESLAPTAPPCFGSRLQWVEYLVSASHAQSEDGQPAPLVFVPGAPTQFNHRFDFCTDCDSMFRRAMDRMGKCSPTWLVDATKDVVNER